VTLVLTVATGSLAPLKRGSLARQRLVHSACCLGRLRHFYSWAVKTDYVLATPFKKGTEAIVELYGEAKRERRLVPDVLDDDGNVKVEGEQRRLFAVANPHLQALMTAALETGCRVGELLSLQWIRSGGT
jgi:integrase